MSLPESRVALVALLRRRDEPTDALRDYCDWLVEALARRAVCLELQEIAWEREGWLRALVRLWLQSKQWRDRWVLLALQRFPL